MGLYGEHVLPRIINVACGLKSADPLRIAWRLETETKGRHSGSALPRKTTHGRGRKQH